MMFSNNQRPKALAVAQQYATANPTRVPAHVHLRLGAGHHQEVRSGAGGVPEGAHRRSQERCSLSAHGPDLPGHGQVGSGALAIYQKALAIQPSSTTLNNAIGDVYLAKGDLKSAGKYFQAALSENAHDPIAANNLAWVYAQQGDNLDMALSLATQAKQIAPEMNAVNDTLAWIQYKKGNYQVSVSFAEDAVRRAPENPAFRYHLGMALSGAGDKDRARTELQKALVSEPEGTRRAGRAEDPGLAQVVR